MPLTYPIGVSNFREIREGKLAYVDKSALITDLIDDGAKVVLLPRPRRFGKTLNLSMLRYFFEKRDEDLSHLFSDLAVWRAGEGYRAHFQQYPVISLTFKDVKETSFEAAWKAIRLKIQDLYVQHRPALDGGSLDEVDAARFRSILAGDAPHELYPRALADLTRYLAGHHRRKVIVLIDEYDEPLHAAYVHGYTEPIMSFFRAFLTGGLKDNPHLHKGVLTGILRVARESIFSGLNNLAVYSLLRRAYSTHFGFTEPEVADLLAAHGQSELSPEVARWYNGYVFGETVVYNPWSLVNYLAHPGDGLQSYWLGSSSNDLIKEVLQEHALQAYADLQVLLEGGRVERALEEHVVFADLREREPALWSVLVFSGYLRAEPVPRASPGDAPTHLLSIPNREVREVYTSTFQDWMLTRLRGHGGNLQKLTRALLSGDAETVEEQLQAFVINVLSYNDPAASDPEAVYHGFVTGLLASLEPHYIVRSNRESGKGRPDVTIRGARGAGPAAVMELKVARRKKTLEQALSEGLDQIARNDYAADLRASGADPVHAFAVAFDGKEVRVRSGAP